MNSHFWIRFTIITFGAISSATGLVAILNGYRIQRKIGKLQVKLDQLLGPVKTEG